MSTASGVATGRSDALVLFGATGDLARKMLYPALYELARSGNLPDIVVGVALTDWHNDELVEHVRASIIESAGELDGVVFERLVSALSYVRGDYRDRSTYTSLAEVLSDRARPERDYRHLRDLWPHLPGVPVDR